MVKPVADHVSGGFNQPMNVIPSCVKSESGEGGDNVDGIFGSYFMKDLVDIPDSSNFMIWQFGGVVDFSHEDSGIGKFFVGSAEKALDLLCRSVFIYVPAVNSD